MPPNAALHGIAVDHLMRWNLIAMLLCFAAAHVWLIAMLGRRHTFPKALRVTPTGTSGAGSASDPEAHAVREDFRSGQRQPARTDATTLLTLPLLLILCMYAWMAVTAQHLWAANRFEGASPEAMQVEVVGQQFQWYFRYPGQDARFGLTEPRRIDAAAGNPLGLDPADPAAKDDLVSSILVLPVGREVDLRLRSLDVIHGFFIPAMRLKQNAVPGLVLHVHFTPIAVGVYPILCTQVCGLGHQRMQAELRVVSAVNYQQWIEQREQQRERK